jgi:hypothetical protein
MFASPRSPERRPHTTAPPTSRQFDQINEVIIFPEAGSAISAAAPNNGAPSARYHG